MTRLADPPAKSRCDSRFVKIVAAWTDCVHCCRVSSQTEIITAREALTRVGLPSLALPYGEETKVQWHGYPMPFACGHYDAKGRRVNRAHCGGAILFAWSPAPGEYAHTSLVVVVEPETAGNEFSPDWRERPSGSALSAAWTG